MTEKGLSFPKSWYPLCRSSDVKRGKVIRQIAFGVPLAICRTRQRVFLKSIFAVLSHAEA